MVMWTTATTNELLEQQPTTTVIVQTWRIVLENGSVRLMQHGLDQLLHVQVSSAN